MKLLKIIFLLIAVNANCQDVKVITYNIRYDNPNDGENRWDMRKQFLSEQMQFYAPDVLGIQEGKLHQLNYLDSTLVDYKYIGTGRDSSPDQGEFSAIFYNHKKLRLIKEATFWLSETPGRISKGWDAMFERICTYGLFESIATKQRFYIFNTHFDHVGVVARRNSAKLIVEKINAINAEGFPFILTGDFNSETDSDAYKYLSSQINDSRIIGKNGSFGPSGTFNNFEFHKPVRLLIDFIFTSKNNIEVLKHAVLSDSRDCRYPSDHLPVYAEIVFKK